MEPTLSGLATALAAVLGPFTPYLVKSGKAFAEGAGEAAWKQAQSIWQSIRSHFSQDAKVEGAAMMLSVDPEDREALALFAKAIAAQLVKHPESVSEFIQLLHGPEATQTIVASYNSLVEDVEQHLVGSGRQSINADHGSKVQRVSQKIV